MIISTRHFQAQVIYFFVVFFYTGVLQKSQLWKVHPAGPACCPDAEGPQIPPPAAGTVYTLYPSPNPNPAAGTVSV